jgi:uncharacterized repeat protein (TIGR01451 family)
MIKNVLIVSVMVSSYLLGMGNTINYDNQFNTQEEREVDANAINTTNILSRLKLETFAFQEKNGRNVPVKRVKRGSKVVYINRVTNLDGTPKKNIVVKNPIPRGTKYIVGSAKCENGCTISFSTDGGRTFVEQEREGEDYNYIEFYFKEIPPFKKLRMGFRTIVK